MYNILSKYHKHELTKHPGETKELTKPHTEETWFNRFIKWRKKKKKFCSQSEFPTSLEPRQCSGAVWRYPRPGFKLLRVFFHFDDRLTHPDFPGLQLILPDYLREDFVRAALSYIACNGEGEFRCKDNDCWCNCDPKFPECNCPYMDIQAMEESLQRITETWGILYKEFEESGNKDRRWEILPRPFFFCLAWFIWMQETQTFWNINYSYGKGKRDDEFKCFIWIIKSLRGPYTSISYCPMISEVKYMRLWILVLGPASVRKRAKWCGCG